MVDIKGNGRSNQPPTKTPLSMNTPDFRIIIAGSRTFSDYNKLATHCDRLLAEKKKTHNIVIVSGTCRGADLMGERYAQEHGYSIARYPADWQHLGKFAGIQRNLTWPTTLMPSSPSGTGRATARRP